MKYIKLLISLIPLAVVYIILMIKYGTGWTTAEQTPSEIFISMVALLAYFKAFSK